jgi:hypothetical protein
VCRWGGVVCNVYGLMRCHRRVASALTRGTLRLTMLVTVPVQAPSSLAARSSGRVHELQPARPCGSTRRGAASSRSRQQAAAGPAAGRAAQHCWCAAAGCSHRNRRPSFIAGPQQHPPPPSVLPRCRGAQQAQHRLAPWAAVLRGPPLVCPWEGSVVPVSCYLRWGSFEAATQGRGHGGMGLPAW